MAVNNLTKVWHAAIGYLNSIPVENLAEGVILGEGGFHYLKKDGSNSGFAIEGPWWVKPDYITFSISFTVSVVVVAI